MGWIIKILLGFVAIYGVIAAALFIFQRQFLYFPPDFYLAPEAVGVSEMQAVSIDGITGFWSPPIDDKPVIMFFHGNGSAVYSNHDIFRDLIAGGYGVWSAGYPGYPGSAGQPNQSAIMQAAQAQYGALIARNIKPEDIIFFGTSLGTGIAAQLAQTNPPALLIMEAPFNSMLDMARGHMPMLPVRVLLKDQYRSDTALAGLDVPMIWLHGTADTIIPLAQGQKLYDGYNGPKAAHIISGGQHTNLWGLGGKAIIMSALARMPRTIKG